jgi:hypothetical protein
MAIEFAHIELMTHDPEGARKFYSAIFDWKWEEYPMATGPYWMIDPGTDPKGGIMKAPHPDIPPHWMAYTKVNDVARDKSLEFRGRPAVCPDPCRVTPSDPIYPFPTLPVHCPIPNRRCSVTLPDRYVPFDP